MPACDECHRRKTKCDGQRPRCAPCARRSARCSYPERQHYVQRRQHQVQSLEQRLQLIESETRLLKRATIEHDRPPSAESTESPLHEPPRTAEVAPEAPDDVPVSELTAETPKDQPAATDQPDSQSRYLGSSAGVDFVGLVEHVLGTSASPEGPGHIFTHVTDAYRKPGTPRVHTNPTISPGPISSSIPPKSLALPMIAGYFAHWHVTFPLLYRPSFLKLVKRIYEEPNFYRNDAAGAFVFDVVLALGSVGSKKSEWSFKDTDSHFKRATSRLDSILAYRDLRSVQAYLLCCQYGIHASLRDTAEEMWELVGKSGRLCIELGLHRWTPSQRPSKVDSHLTGDIPENLHDEMRRRCFWCFYSLERIITVTLGRPFLLSDDDIDVPMPSSDEDEQLTSAEPGSSEQSWQSSMPQEPLSAFLQLIRIRKIISKTHRFLYTSTTTKSLPMGEKQAIRRGLLNELETWKSNIDRLNFQTKNEPWSSLSAFTFPTWYQALYHTNVLALFRPSPAFPFGGLQTSQVDENALASLWEASRMTISTYKSVLQARRLNYSWICLYTVFMAGLANIYSVARCAQRYKSDPTSFLPPVLEVTSDIRDCSNILIAICERWDDARSSCEIFDRLGNSALMGLFKVQLPESRLSTTTMAKNARVQAGSNEGTAPFTAPDDNTANGSATAGNMASADVGLFYSNGLDQSGNIDDFQNLFQNVQTDLYGNGFDGANEVFMSLDNQWFEDIQ